MADSDNPITETVDLFYTTTVAEPDSNEQPVEETVTKDEAQSVEEESSETEQPDTEEEAKAELDGSEEVESESDSNVTEDQEEELVYLELDGKDVSLDEVRKWRDEGLMQANFTRKTTAVAEKSKALDAELEGLGVIKEDVLSLKAELQAAMEVDQISKADLDEMREYDQDAYIKHTEKQAKRKTLVDKLTNDAPVTITPEQVKQERAKMAEAHPEWVSEGKSTKAYTDDMKLVNEFAGKHFTQEEFSGMGKATYIEVLLKAAKYDKLKGKTESIVKKVKKATLVTKTTQAQKVNKEPKSMADTFYS